MITITQIFRCTLHSNKFNSEPPFEVLITVLKCRFEDGFVQDVQLSNGNLPLYNNLIK